MKKIVFIIDPGRSGSTVLSKFLGMHSRCFSLSEPKHFDIEIAKNSICSCGENYSNCSFWGKILKLLPDGKSITSMPFNSDKTPIFIKAIKYINLFLFVKFGTPFLFRKYHDAMRNNAILLDTINNSIEENVLIDASKDITRAFYLSRYLKKEYKSIFMVLTRDPKATIFSTMKNKYYINLNSGVTSKVYTVQDDNRMDLDQAISSWISTVQRILRQFNWFGIKFFHIAYEDFANDPKREFGRISAYIGVEWEEQMLDLNCKEHHLIGGNSSRINAKYVNKPLEEWRNFSDDEIKEIEVRTRKVHNKLLK